MAFDFAQAERIWEWYQPPFALSEVEVHATPQPKRRPVVQQDDRPFRIGSGAPKHPAPKHQKLIVVPIAIWRPSAS